MSYQYENHPGRPPWQKPADQFTIITKQVEQVFEVSLRSFKHRLPVGRVPEQVIFQIDKNLIRVLFQFLQGQGLPVLNLIRF